MEIGCWAIISKQSMKRAAVVVWLYTNKTGAMIDEFAIKEGRSGDFIEDKHGKKIPLTALIFGRHNKAFDVADYIQIG